MEHKHSHKLLYEAAAATKTEFWKNKINEKVRLPTSSQMEARTSEELFLALSISMIDSNGFGCKGVNPVANLEVRTEPIEPHFRNSSGMVWFRRLGFELPAKVARVCVLVRRFVREETPVRFLTKLNKIRCILWRLMSENEIELLLGISSSNWHAY